MELKIKEIEKKIKDLPFYDSSEIMMTVYGNKMDINFNMTVIPGNWIYRILTILYGEYRFINIYFSTENRYMVKMEIIL